MEQNLVSAREEIQRKPCVAVERVPAPEENVSRK